MSNNATSPAPIANLRALRNTLVLGAIFLLLFAPRYTGFMLMFVAPVFVCWLCASVFIIACNPARRHLQSIKLAIWLGLFAAVGGIHAYRTWHTRVQADEIVAIVEKYSREHGHCPTSLDEFGIDKAELSSRLSMAYYVCDAGIEPHLAYGVPTVPFDMYSYDFKTKRWRYRGG